MSNLVKNNRYLTAILAFALAIILSFVFLFIKGGWSSANWISLFSQMIPGLVGGLLAYTVLFFALEKQGIILGPSDEQTAKGISKELLKYLHGQPNQASSSVHDLTGKWKTQDWRHDQPEDKKDSYTDDAEIFQSGLVVWGKFSTMQGPMEDGKRTPYAFYGDLESDILTGRWWQIGGSSPWKGAFQFKITPSPFKKETMEGCWVGFSRDKAKINMGYWEWARPDNKFPSELHCIESDGSSELSNAENKD